MVKSNRREFLAGATKAAGAVTAVAMFPPAIRKALAIPARRRHGDIRDVEHIVILMQENRSFDHYFGTLAGVRGFGDRFPIPVQDSPGIVGKSVWFQPDEPPAESDADAGVGSEPRVIAPFHLNTHEHFEYMRVEGTPHTWPDAQYGWADGKLNEWPRYKKAHSLGYFKESDLPFQFAMANAFTICDAYHCSFQGGTNPNRMFLWTGTNDPLGQGNGPVIYNTYDNVEHDPNGGYTFTTYCERLERAGVSFQIYQDMADNFTDNPLAGFRSYRASYYGEPGANPALAARALSTHDLDELKADVLADRLPQVSFIVGTAEGSEHPGPSSPAQGAEYTAKVLEALTANPEVWSKTVFIVNFDENDGFFDHVPPPAAPSYELWSDDPTQAKLAGASTVDTTGEYHELPALGTEDADQLPFHRPYGLGPRVPLYVLSPWTKGGWVSSQVFDHTSVIRFIELRFGVTETNISAWRRAVCGDLSSVFNFADPDATPFYAELPQTKELAQRARELPERTTPVLPELPELPTQARGVRPSRALPYALHVHASATGVGEPVSLRFENTGSAAAVFHVYDRLHLERVPRRYTVEPHKHLSDTWRSEEDGRYDLWVLGPNGFHRHFVGTLAAASGAAAEPEARVFYEELHGGIYIKLRNAGAVAAHFTIAANAYFEDRPVSIEVAAGSEAGHYVPLDRTGHWYDFTITLADNARYLRRIAGRVETGRPSWSDPALGGTALGDQLRIV
jgi:phospholipase C